MDLSIFATPPSYLNDSLFKPVTQEIPYVQSNEYFQREDVVYLPIKFDMLSIAINGIQKFKNISSEKWAESGYKFPLEETFSNATLFLSCLPDRYLFNLDTENIEPTSYGTFVLDFFDNSDRISIEIGKDKIGYYTEFANKENFMSEGLNFNGNDVPKEIFEVFEKML
ncbi:hypothetical protein FA048_05935 [Pedobacter polaris]|uniref:Uncharacterized protein n=1 Tax=Pedobacter polaris TaxID=2571273 RepID=A0A4V5P1U8_9SPHI|nr:hypothetical protein [Pedobacter polaris]TKC13152.1 hypothetical protein FA048_05935 [Pedobacter polaris]